MTELPSIDKEEILKFALGKNPVCVGWPLATSNLGRTRRSTECKACGPGTEPEPVVLEPLHADCFARKGLEQSLEPSFVFSETRARYSRTRPMPVDAS